MSLPLEGMLRKGRLKYKILPGILETRSWAQLSPGLPLQESQHQTFDVSRSILGCRNVCTTPGTKARMPWRNSNRLLWEPCENISSHNAGLGTFLLPEISRLCVDRHTWDAPGGGKSSFNVFPKQPIYPHLLQSHPRGWVGWSSLVEGNPCFLVLSVHRILAFLHQVLVHI